MEQSFRLIIIFGNDQAPGIDNLLTEMNIEGNVKAWQKKAMENGEATQYLIDFLGPYSIYLFGRRQSNLIEYFLRDKN